MFFVWVICDEFGLKGIKFGCGVVMCGVCMVYIDGNVICFCFYFVLLVKDKNVNIIESFNNVYLL